MKDTLNSLTKFNQNQFSVFAVIIILLFVAIDCKYLKSEPDIESYKQELITAIRRADNAEIEATRKLDKAPLAEAYKREALLAVEKGVDSLVEQGIYAESVLEDQEFESFKFLESGRKAEVRVVETWKTTYYNKEDDKCYSIDPSHKAPQTITLEKFNAIWFVVAVVHDLNAPQSTIESCEETSDEETTNITRYDYPEAKISYEIPNDWTVSNDKGERSFESADKKLVVIIKPVEGKDAEAEIEKIGKQLKEIFGDIKSKGDPEEYTIDGMNALRTRASATNKGSNVDLGLDVLDSGKAVIILHIFDPDNTRNAYQKIQSTTENVNPTVQEFKTFLDSIRKL